MVTLSKATFLDQRFARDLAAIGQAVEVDILSAEQKVTDDVCQYDRNEQWVLP